MLIRSTEVILEGPSLVILREELKPFIGHKVLRVRGNTKQPKATLKGRTLTTSRLGEKIFSYLSLHPAKSRF
jgi:hypothetical protein